MHDKSVSTKVINKLIQLINYKTIDLKTSVYRRISKT